MAPNAPAATSVISRGSMFLSAGAAVLPVVLVAFYLTITRGAEFRLPELADMAALLFACAVGAACLWQLVRRLRWRFVLMAAYLVCMGTAKFAFSVAFVCSAFGDCI
jgi:hypothetical protein